MHRLSLGLEQKLIEYLVQSQNQFYYIAYGYLKNQEDALDAVQTAVCRALERQSSLRNPDAMRTWFYRILIHVCTDILRQKNRLIFLPTEELDAGSYDDPQPEDGSLAQQVDALPPELALIIRLRFYEELSLAEISTVTGVNLNTVKTRLYSALKKLRLSMEGATL